MTLTTHLLIIDPQNDFCDLPEAWRATDPRTGEPHTPSLPVSGAHQDLLRVARLIDVLGSDLSAISVTLDTHHLLDIGHPGFWITEADRPPDAFTQVTAAQVRAGHIAPRDSGDVDRVLWYLDELESRNRYTHMVWPVHCEFGSWGHGVHEGVHAAYNRWELATGRSVGKLPKGMNRWTENYSIFEAEVPDPADPATQLNHALLDELDQADRILVCGEASSHCVSASARHLFEHLPGGALERVIILTDAMSPVAGFQDQHEAFLREAVAQGARLSTSAEMVSARTNPA